MTKFYQYLADAILFLHFSFVFFIIVSLILILLGGCLKWAWIRNWWFRVVHLVGISFVVVQSWLGLICPLTTLEMWLRAQVNEAHYTGSFIQYWLQRILYYQASDWVFILIYTLFGLLVIVSWVRLPPHK
ncbi:DUF2784 domain-containing protein [Vibrio sp. Of7-15]|uniref:DUF2784 domain-containing protein n=1 Tax=Vibrio sp. Of7-15 TaxID=2724879 RepID=UPI001EF3B6A2|nr:DUF2784 domain-containing protein [Vibrio sp. Of7-15]MCG7499649.1 DUF2784 domain-containing protein [Vibrio sp. Of7-15]